MTCGHTHTHTGTRPQNAIHPINIGNIWKSEFYALATAWRSKLFIKLIVNKYYNGDIQNKINVPKISRIALDIHWNEWRAFNMY